MICVKRRSISNIEGEMTIMKTIDDMTTRDTGIEEKMIERKYMREMRSMIGIMKTKKISMKVEMIRAI